MQDSDAQVQFIKDHVRARIIRAELAEGSRLDDEDLRHATGATVRAVRRALNELAQEGLLTRRQRLGTFVAQGVARAGTSPLPIVRSIAVLSTLSREALGRLAFTRDIFEGMAFASAKPLRIEYFTPTDVETRSIDMLPAVDAEMLKGLVQGVVGIEANHAGRLNTMARAGLPVVAIDFHTQDAAFDSVYADHEDAGFQATVHLLALGHRRIVFIGERCNPRSSDPTWQQRMTGYLRGVAWSGGETPRPLVLGGPRDPTNLERDLPPFHKRHRPTAYVLASGGLAPEVLRVLQLIDVECPRDVSLACCDNSRVRDGGLAFSYSRADYDLAGRTAIQLIASRLACRAMPPVRVTIPMTFIPGESSRALPGEEDMLPVT
ncbi:MAG: substrate-binding domain-containing protein [Planctomycetes bacterium]|nr:substrate-binding domain-containing protein [Planctomycetota bacterium]